MIDVVNETENATGLHAFDDLDPISALSALNLVPEPEPAPYAVPQPAARVSAPPPRAPKQTLLGMPQAMPPRPSTVPPPPPVRSSIRPPAPLPSQPVPRVHAVADQTQETETLGHAHAHFEAESVRRLTDDAELLDLSATRESAGGGATLDMDWDEEEPETQMREEAERRATDDESFDDGWGSSEDEPTRVAPTPSEAPANYGFTESGRPAPFPAGASAAPLLARASSARPGAPSPFERAEPVRHDRTDTGIHADWSKGAPSRTPWVVASVAAALALGVLGWRAWFAGPQVGGATVSTSPTDVVLYLDGNAVSATQSPFALSGIVTGKGHTLEARKPGYVSGKLQFSVEAGKTTALPEIELKSLAEQTGFAIDSTPQGATVLVDGEPSGQVTPAKLSGLSKGLHTVRVDQVGHEPWEIKVMLTEGELMQLPVAALTAQDAKATAKSSPVKASEQVAAAAESTVPSPSRKASASSRHGAHSAARAARAARSVPAPSSFKAKASNAAPAAAKSAAGQGVLRINSRPWSRISVDGKVIGNTPQLNLQLSAGTHTVKLENPDMRLTKTVKVDIKAGQTVTKVLNLAE